MTDEELREAVLTIVDDPRYEPFVEFYLEQAKNAVIERRWPYYEDAIWEDVPERYHTNVVEIAVFLINKRGAEGETYHTESGVNRTYETASIPPSFLRGITPMCGVPQ